MKKKSKRSKKATKNSKRTRVARKPEKETNAATIPELSAGRLATQSHLPAATRLVRKSPKARGFMLLPDARPELSS
jgi:hypothetical protein